MENIKEIKQILKFLEEAVEKAPEWKEEKPKTETKFKAVSDTGDHTMDEDDFDKVNTDATKNQKKVETKPAFKKVTGDVKGGATGVDGAGKAKEVKLKESVSDIESLLPADKQKAAREIREAIEKVTGKKVVYQTVA